MLSIALFLDILWVIFWAYWLISATHSKKSAHSNTWWRGAIVRVIILILVLWYFRGPNEVSLFIVYANPYIHNIVLNIVGLLLWFLGVGFAVWARVYLGKNWGMPMSLKEQPELVTSGPYKYVRHPIYSGFLLALIASYFVSGIFWLLIFIVSGTYFIYSAIVEEKNMAKLFPDVYPEYKKRTKMFIPFVF